MKNAKKLGTIALLVLVLVVLYQVREVSNLKQDLRLLNHYMETEFTISKEWLCESLAQGKPEEASKYLEKLKMITAHGQYVHEHGYGPDAFWHELVVEWNEVLSNEEIYKYLSSDDRSALVDFLSSHTYRDNDDSDGRLAEELAAMLDTAERAVEKYLSE